jgi:hypothetical protein
MPSKLELTFFKSKKQWKKKKHGRVVYLGHGDGKNDLASYRAALAKWREMEPKLDEQYRIANDPRTEEEKRGDQWWVTRVGKSALELVGQG